MLFDVAVAVSGICRDDNCKIEGLHGAHAVRAKKEPKECLREPPEALDDSIERAVYRLGIACFRSILSEVENDFGSLGPTYQSGLRRLHRRIAELVKRTKICKLEVGEGLFAYVPPDGRKRDATVCRNVIKEQFSFDLCGRPRMRWAPATLEPANV